MTENQSISKKERMDYDLGDDLLSELPMGIIHTILALVPIREAVRTSVLSKQWRYTWASLPHLAFDDECVSTSGNDAGFGTRLSHFITQTLFHHKGPIEKFIMSKFWTSDIPDIDDWILCLSRKDIKEFTLGANNCDDQIKLYSSIYSCEKLTKLVLCDCDLDPPPLTFKGFLFLRCLILQWVSLSRKAIDSLLSNSPLLEKFELGDSFENHELRMFEICTPNLKCLNLSGDFNELRVYAPLLIDISVTMSNDNFMINQQQTSSVCNYANFMGGFTSLEKLSGRDYFAKYLSVGVESCHHTLVFHQLKHIEIVVDFKSIKVISVVARLIVGAPNLQELKIIDDTGGVDNFNFYTLEGDDELSFKDFGCGPNFTFSKLRVVKMEAVRGPPLEMEFIKFLLESSPMLETMGLPYLRARDKLKLAVELLGFCRASSKAKITFSNF